MFFRSQCLSYSSLQISFFPIQNCAIPIPIPKLLQGLPFNIANASHAHAYVVVIFLSQVIFVFLLFLGMIMYANEVETKEK